jgi:hypothetical protein
LLWSIARGKIGKPEDVYVDVVVETDEPLLGIVKEGTIGPT